MKALTKDILIKRATAGGKARGMAERKDALLRYHSSPHFCQECRSMMVVGNRRVADVMKKKFCNSACAARYNNRKHPERYRRFHGFDSLTANSPQGHVIL